MAKALKINAGDNVAVVLADVKAGEEVGVMTDTDVVQIRAQQDIAFGHKIAEVGAELLEKVVRIASGEPSRADLLGHDELFCITRI